MGRRIILSPAQRLEFTTVPDSISDDVLEYYYTLSDDELSATRQHRGDENKLGFAMNVCCLRHKGWPFLTLTYVSPKAISFVATQIGVSAGCISRYGESRNTKFNHILEICESYGYRQETAWDDLSKYVESLSSRLRDETAALKEIVAYAVANRIILPRITTLEKMVNDTMNRMDAAVFARISSSLSEEQKNRLDSVLTSEGNGLSELFRLKDVSGRWNSKSMNSILEKLTKARSLEITDDLTWLHPNLLKYYYKIAVRYDASRIRRFADDKRHSLLVILIYQLRFGLVDMAIDMNDKILVRMESEARKTMANYYESKRDEIGNNYKYFRRLGEEIYNAIETGADLREVVEKTTTMEELRAKLDSKYTPHEADQSYYQKMISGYSVLRLYVPNLFDKVTFTSASPSSVTLVKAIASIKEMYAGKGSRLKPDIPVDFLGQEWVAAAVSEDGKINRDAYIVAVMLELRRQLRSGDVCVEGSSKYRSLETMLVSKDAFEIGSMGVGSTYSEYVKSRIADFSTVNRMLDDCSESVRKVIRKNDGKLHPERLENEVPDGAEKLNGELYSLLPRVTLSEIMFEVNEWTHFTDAFTHLSTGRGPVEAEIPPIIAALSAMGLNIGLQKMSESTDDISYKSMVTASNWRLCEEGLKRAQAILVNYQHHLPLAREWGDGTTSSSDGMRVICSVRSVLASHNPHYGSAQGVTMYRHTSDEYSAFYVNVINTNIRDAVHVIDGILHHESELDIQRHYTDTAGYTDQIFGLTHLLGFMFAPRIRDISDCQLFSIPGAETAKVLSGMDFHKINTPIIEENFEEVMRIAYSIKYGYVSADTVMSKLGSYSRQNSIAKALREMGRIEKTIFILKYVTDERLRREILVGLNKGEAMNGMARALFFGKSGNLREKDWQNQLQRASCLNILLNIIVIWNTVYLQKAVDYIKESKGGLDETLLKHVSPLNWGHIQLYGKYYFNSNLLLPESGFRPLRIQEENGLL